MLAETSAACLACETHKEIALGRLRFPLMLSLSAVNSAYRVTPTPSALPSLHNTSYSPPLSPRKGTSILV